MIYFLLVVFLFFFVLQFDLAGKTKNKDFWYNVVLVVLIFLAGMRYRVGIDTTNEVYDFFHRTPTIDKLFDDLSLIKYPLWKIINSIVYTLGGKFYMVQFIEAIFVNVLVFKYIKKHSEYIFTCVFFYFLILYASYNFEEMKASFSAAICLYANDYVLEKKWAKGILLYIIGCLFHISTVVLIPFSLLLFIRLNKVGVAFLVFSYFLGVFVEAKIEDYLYLFGDDDFLAGKIETYATSERWGGREGSLNIIGITNKVLGYIYPIAGLLFMKWKDKSNSLLRLEPFFVFCLFFMTLTLSIPIFYRYSHFYDIYYILFVSYAFATLLKDERLSKAIVYLRGFALFIPFFVHVAIGYTSRIDKFYPYSSVIDRTVYKSKEKRFNENRPVPNPKDDEY